MKLLRWTLAGASFYIVYKYTIGNKAKGEKVFSTPETGEPVAPTPAPAATPAPSAPQQTPGTAEIIG